MTSKRFYFLMIGLNILCLVSIFGFVYFANNLIKGQSDKLVTAKTSTKVAEEKQTALLQAKKDIEKYSELNQIARSIVPQDKDQARTVREINKLATESNIELKDIKFQSSNLGQAVPKASSSDSSASSSAPKTVAPPISQVKPIDGINGVYTLELVISSTDTKPVPYNDFINFLEKLETNRRTAHVSQIVIKPNEKLGGIGFSLTLNAYVKP